MVLLAVLATLFYTNSKQGNELVVLQEQLKQKENQLQELKKMGADAQKQIPDKVLYELK